VKSRTSRTTIWEGLDPGLETYLNIAASCSRGIARIWEAEAASSKLLRASSEFRASDQPSVEGAATGALRYPAHILNNSLESLLYVTNISHLLYAATLFDSFLSETSQFLFLLIPRAMGESQPVPLRALTDPLCRNEAITAAAGARTREIATLSFVDRIHFLRKSFALEITVPTETWAGIALFSSVGDIAARDRGGFELQLDTRGEIVSKESSLSRSSTEVNRNDLRWVIESYELAARTISEAVFTQILKQTDHPAVQLLLKGSTLNIDLSPSYGRAGD
jgi:hypothetical protein